MNLILIIFICSKLGHICLGQKARRDALEYVYKDWEEPTEDYIVLPSLPTTATTASTATKSSQVPESVTITTPPSTIKQLPLEHEEIYNEILRLKDVEKTSTTTAMLYVAFDSIAKKEPEHIAALAGSFHAELQKLSTEGKLAVLGTKSNQVLVSMLGVLAATDCSYLKSTAEYAKSLLLQRRNQISADVNAVIDAADRIYIEDDVKTIAITIKEIQNYPANKSALEIAQEAYQNAVLEPLHRIQGTVSETSLVKEVQNTIDSRIASLTSGGSILSGFRKTDVGGRRNYIDDFVEKILRYITYPPTTGRTSLPDIPSEYLKNTKLRGRLHERMKKYKKRKSENIKREKRLSTKRGITRTPTTMTQRPKMRKSKYYIQKYVKKNLYRMTTKPPTTTRDPWKFYSTARKQRQTLLIEETTSSSQESPEAKELKLNDNYNIDKINNENVLKWITQRDILNVKYSENTNLARNLERDDEDIADKNLNTKKQQISDTEETSPEREFKKSEKNILKHNINSDTQESGPFIRVFDLQKSQETGPTGLLKSNTKKIKNVYSSEELLTKKHISDRINQKTSKAGNGVFKTNYKALLETSDSESDNETKLKSNLYKAMGYKSDYAKTFKRSL